MLDNFKMELEIRLGYKDEITPTPAEFRRVMSGEFSEVKEVERLLASLERVFCFRR